MDVTSHIHEHLGPVVPVDDDPDPRQASSVTLHVPPPGTTGAGQGAGPTAPTIGGGPGGVTTPTLSASPSSHQIVASGDEHHILTTPGGQRAAQQKAHPPKFSTIMNEYVGACFEDNCNIGKDHIYISIQSQECVKLFSRVKSLILVAHNGRATYLNRKKGREA